MLAMPISLSLPLLQRRRLLLASACLAPPLHAQPQAQPLSLAGTATHLFESARLGRRYPVLLGWPRGVTPGTPLPVVLLLDGEPAFPWLHGVSDFMRRHAQGGGLADFLLVGLGYAQGDTPAASRRRDYTPWQPLRPPKDSAAKDFGGAPAYADHLEAELLPWLAKTFSAQVARPTVLGHSYGGLFAAWLALHRAARFPQLVASSPSLWLDHRRLLREAEALTPRWPAPQRLFLGVGGYERVQRGDPRYNQHDDMVADLDAFARRLRALGLGTAQLRQQVQAQDDHATAMLGNYTQALRWMLPRSA